MLCFRLGLCKVYYHRTGGTRKPQLDAHSLTHSACPSRPEAHSLTVLHLSLPDSKATQQQSRGRHAPTRLLPGRGQSCSSLSRSSLRLRLAIWHCQEDLCLEPRCSQAQTRADASLQLNNNLISWGSAGKREEREGKYSANSRVCFSGARTSTVLGCWEGAVYQLEQPKGWCGPRSPI